MLTTKKIKGLLKNNCMDCEGYYDYDHAEDIIDFLLAEIEKVKLETAEECLDLITNELCMSSCGCLLRAEKAIYNHFDLKGEIK